MIKYRICENGYGHYKIQRWYEPKKILGIFKISGKWVDTGFNMPSRQLVIFDTKAQAEEQIRYFIEENQKKTRNWSCCGEIYS